jgi:hypothetical protein
MRDVAAEGFENGGLQLGGAVAIEQLHRNRYYNPTFPMCV